jgi:hypothetical protein
MTKKWALIVPIVVLAIWSAWLTVEVRKLHNVRRELADLVATRDGMKANAALLWRARRPSTKAELRSLNARLDVLESNLRDLRTSGR